jgi:ATP-dependent Lhr-like helicase
MDIAQRFPAFPIVLETYREMLQDYFDLPALRTVLTDIERRTTHVSEVDLAGPSPFATSLMFDFIASYMYEYDAPLAEKRAAALTLDRRLLQELLGDPQFRDLLDPDVIAAVELELQHLAEDRRLRSPDAVNDALRRLGPLSYKDLSARSADPSATPAWIRQLADSRRIVEVMIQGAACWAVVEDVARLRDALGVQPPPGVPETLLEPVEDPLGDVIGRYARTHAPFTAGQAAHDLGLPEAVVTEVLTRLESDSRVASGAYQPGGQGMEWVDLEVLRRLRRRSLAVLRREVEAVDTHRLGAFLPAWHNVGSAAPAAIRLPEVVRALQGRALPASILEHDVLGSRMDYSPAELDLLLASGEVVWLGHGSLGTNDGRVALYFRDHVPLLFDRDETMAPSGELHELIRTHLATRGASFFNDIYVACGGGDMPPVIAALWDLVWAGELTNDTISPLRAFTSAKSKRRPSRPSLRLTVPPAASGRWYLVQSLLGGEIPPSPEQRAKAQAEQLLERHGVVTRSAVLSEGVPGGFSGLYPVFATMEDTGQVRRGYFIETLGGAQFGLPGAIDRLRDSSRSEIRVLAAADPANPYGAAVPWPDHEAGSPGRHAGAYVVLNDGLLAAFVERGTRSVLAWDTEPALLAAGLIDVAKWKRKAITIGKINGESTLTSQYNEALLAAGFATGYKGLTYRR